jgi:hypothetical protein
MSWRSAALLAGGLAAVLGWQNSCLRHRPGGAATRAPRDGTSARDGSASAPRAATAAAALAERRGDEGEAVDDETEPAPARPHWALELVRPRPGEDLAAYRDRVLPIAQAVIAPQRTRVAAVRQRVAAAAKLDARQLAELDAAVGEASDAIVNRVWDAVGSGEVWPRLRPAAGVALAADLLTAVVGADRRFRAALSAEQLATVDREGFDVADYLLFSVPWEERFGLVAPDPEMKGGR